MLDKTQGENRRRDSGGVSNSNREEGADDRGPALFLQAKGMERSVLITDATAASGMPDGT